MTQSDIELRPITPENYPSAMALSVREDQTDLVATVTESLADAYVYEGSIFRLAFVNDKVVGYLLLYPYVEDDRAYVNIVRLMIDQDHQGRGFGRALLASAIALIRTLTPTVDKARISTLPHNEPALNLYRSAGFIESGVERGEVALYLALS